MKQIVLAPLLAILLVACGGNSKNTAEGETSKAKNEEHNEYENEDETGDAPVVNAICLWKELSLRAEPGSEGKWLTNVLMGENMEYLGEDEVLSEGGKDVTYNKVALADGTQGWVKSDFVALDAQRGAILETTKIYKRPDILTVTDKEFHRMDFVAIISENGDWYEVKTKLPSEKWFLSGYIKKSYVTLAPDDVAFSILYQKLDDIKDENQKAEALEQLITENDLKNSQFAADAKTDLHDMEGYSFNVDAAIDCKVGYVKMKAYDNAADRNELIKSMTLKPIPALFNNVAAGEYTLILKSDSLVAVHHFLVDADKDGQEIYIDESKFRSDF